MARVQVNDLADPERLLAQPIQRDTFTQPAQAPINNDLERLSQALGHFNSNLRAYGARKDAEDEKLGKALEKAHKDRVESDLARYRMSTTSAERVQDFKNGTSPHFDDPFGEDAQKKLWAQSEGDMLGAEIDADIAAGNLPLDQEGWNPERYVLDKAKPYLEKLRDRPELMAHFSHEVEAAQKTVTSRYHAELGKARTMRLEQSAALQIEDAFDDATEDGLEGDDLMAYVRSKYVGLGPRLSGGALDIGYDRLDELALDMMKRKSKDPGVAEKVLGALEANRTSLDGSGNQIGPLSRVNKHAGTIAAIQNSAIETLAEQEKADYQRNLLAQNTAKFAAEDGSFSTIIDAQETNSWDQKEMSVSGEKQRDAAAMNFLRQLRQSKDYDPKKEILAFMHNGVKHPEFFNTLEDAYKGIANTNLGTGGSPTPDQMQKIIVAGNLYETLANTNYAYTEANLSTKARDFFEAYRYLLRYTLPPGAPAESVAAQTIRAFASEEGMKDPVLQREQNERIATDVQDVGRGWFQANPDNTQELFTKATNLTRTLVRVNGGDIKKAAEAAVERLKESAVRINGRTLTGLPGIMPGDETNVQRILDATFEKHSKALKAIGADDSDDLTVFPARDGSIQIGLRSGLVAVDENRKPLSFTAADVAKLRQADVTLRRAKALEQSRRRRNGFPELEKNLKLYGDFQ